AVATMAIWVLSRFGFDPIRLLDRAAERSGEGRAYLGPGVLFPKPLDEISTGMAFVLGTCGLPHILMRFLTVPDARAARRSGVLAWSGCRGQLLPGLAFAVAASANFPSLLLALTWRRFTTTGAVVGISVGLASAIVLIILSPPVWPGPDAEGSPVPLANPALI